MFHKITFFDTLLILFIYMNMSLEEPKKQCKFYVVRKKRNCRMHVKEGDEFCAEHLKPKDVEDVKEEDTKSRIVCPLDRTQFVICTYYFIS